MSYGHVLKTIGRQQDSVAAYRRGLEIAPGLGEIWWSLANLKTVKLGEGDIAAMTSALERTDVSPDDGFHLHFALGKALEDAGEAERSFRHYSDGNRLRRAMIDYDPTDIRSDEHTSELQSLMRRSYAVFCLKKQI